MSFSRGGDPGMPLYDLNRLKTDADSILAWIAKEFGPPPFGTPRIAIAENLKFDGLSSPGKIDISAAVLESEETFRDLTLAHELAHQWWGLRCRSAIFPSEPMADLLAVLWIARKYGKSRAADYVRLARGRMLFNCLLQRRVVQDEELGREFLVLYAFWRDDPTVFIDTARTVFASGKANNALAENLSAWFGSFGLLPRPVLMDGFLKDRAEAGLTFFVDVQSRDEVVRTIRYPSNERVSPNARFCESQSAPVLSGDIAGDISHYLQQSARFER